MIGLFKRFAADRSGATAVEYGLLCALIAIVVLGAIQAAGDAIEETYEAVANAQPV